MKWTSRAVVAIEIEAEAEAEARAEFERLAAEAGMSIDRMGLGGSVEGVRSSLHLKDRVRADLIAYQLGVTERVVEALAELLGIAVYGRAGADRTAIFTRSDAVQLLGAARHR